MALSRTAMNVLCPMLESGSRIAAMGYPDIIAPTADIERIFGDKFAALEYRDDSEKIATWHGSKGRVPDAHSFFGLLGCELDVFDVVQHRGSEILCDLNCRMDALDYGYDFVLDVGTLEHCFNIGQAALNMAGLLSKDGIIIHENPLNRGNHGFYNINPTWYHDFYTQDGFTLLRMQVIIANAEDSAVHATNRFRFAQHESNMIAVARRDKILPITFPVQSKYKVAFAALAAPAAGESGDREAA